MASWCYRKLKINFILIPHLFFVFCHPCEPTLMSCLSLCVLLSVLFYFVYTLCFMYIIILYVSCHQKANRYHKFEMFRLSNRGLCGLSYFISSGRFINSKESPVVNYREIQVGLN